MEFDRDKEHTLLGYVGDVDEFVGSERETNLYGMLELLLDLGVDEDYTKGLPGPTDDDLLIGKAISEYRRAKEPPVRVAFPGWRRDFGSHSERRKAENRKRRNHQGSSLDSGGE